jgi:hypothetical protein
MVTAVLSTAFVVFFDQMILIVVFVDPTGKCPIDGAMDCYATYSNGTYFLCNSTDTRIDAALGLAACYRWFSNEISTINVLNQIGVCTGFIQAASWCVEMFLRLNLSIFKRAGADDKLKNKICSCTTFLRKFKHPYLFVPWVIIFTLFFVGGVATFPLAGVLKLSLKGTTFAVLLTALVVSSVLFIWLAVENNIIYPAKKKVTSTVAIQDDT